MELLLERQYFFRIQLTVDLVGDSATIVNGIAITSSTTKMYGNTFTIYKLIISLQEVLVV
jgi:hypothetical protein